MRKGDAIVALLLVVELSACAQVAAVSSSAPSTSSVNEEVQDLAALINKHRKSIGCGSLAWSATIARVAQAHSDDMVRRNYFTHNTPEGVTVAQRLRAAGIQWTREAENIAAGQATAKAVFNAWMASPGHRENIENCKLHEHGIGLTRGDSRVAFGTITNAWTHDFVAE